METTTLAIASAATNVLFSLLPSGFLTNTKATFTQLTDTPSGYYLRADPGEPATTVNVFHGGAKVYSFERLNRYSTQWVMYALPDRRNVAVVTIGLLNRHISFIGKPGTQHRDLTGLWARRFTLSDGATYTWTRRTQLLERLVNFGAGAEERHERLGSARLLRNFRYEWEILVDPEFDAEIALATAFVSTQTQWSICTPSVSPGVPTVPDLPPSVPGLPKLPKLTAAAPLTIDQLPSHLTVYTPPEADPEFFAPKI